MKAVSKFPHFTMTKIFMLSTYLFSCTISIQCFNSSASRPRYANTGNLIHTNVKIHSGGWDSQSTVNMVAYILLKEKVGLNVEFYPPLPDDGENLLVEQDFLHEWSGDFHREDSEFYWHDYDWWCEQNHVHMFMELSSFHHQGEKAAQHLVTDPTGVISKSGYFIPYWMDEGDSRGKDWKNLLTNKTLHNLTYSATYNKSIIWGSLDWYGLSQTAEMLLSYHGLDEIWKIVYLNSDLGLLHKVQELFEAREDFIFLSWTPSIQTSSGNFVPVVWPYNPSGLQRDPCVAEGSCDYADDIVA